MHGAHEDAVFQGGETQVEGAKKIWVGRVHIIKGVMEAGRMNSTGKGEKKYLTEKTSMKNNFPVFSKMFANLARLKAKRNISP